VDIPETAKLIGHLSIVHWALKGYCAVCRMCLTEQQMRWGSASSVSEGEKMDAFFAEAGVKLNNDNGLDGTPVFDPVYTDLDRPSRLDPTPGYIQVWDPNSKTSEERCVLPSPATVRRDPDTYAMQFGDEFCTKWRDYVAYVAQQIMRARHFALVGTSRKELVYIRRIKEFQVKTSAKLMALGVTVGITFGQSISAQLSGLLFGVDDSDQCIDLCAASAVGVG
jgi:hypothetical protein